MVPPRRWGAGPEPAANASRRTIAPPHRALPARRDGSPEPAVAAAQFCRSVKAERRANGRVKAGPGRGSEKGTEAALRTRPPSRPWTRSPARAGAHREVKAGPGRGSEKEHG